MTVRQAVLPVIAVAILGAGVYLYFAVRGLSAPVEVAKAPQVPRPASIPPPPSPHRQPKAAVPAKEPESSEPVIVTGTPQVIVGPPVDREAAFDGPKLDNVMDEANKAYDRGEMDAAKLLAGRVLARYPTNVRMLRIMVSASCQDGDAATAQANYRNLPPGDQEQMRTRCARYGVTFSDKP